MKLVRLFYNRIWLYTLAIVAMLSIAAQGDIPEFGTLEEFLLWVGAGGGATIIAGLVVAYLLENFAWWHNFPRMVKLIVPLALAAAFGFAAQTVIVSDLLTMIPESVQVLLLMLIGWMATQLGYKSIKSGAYGDSARAKASEG